MEGAISTQQKRRRLLVSQYSFTSTSTPLEQHSSYAFCSSDDESKSFIDDLQAAVDEQLQTPGGYQAVSRSVNVNQAEDSFLSIVNPNLWRNQWHGFHEISKSNAISYRSLQGNLLSLDHSKLLSEATCNSKVTSLCSARAEQKSRNFSRICGTRSTSVSPGGRPSSIKTRLKWTADLHEKFVNCVNLLGGAEKAKPKAILKLMKESGLTVLHVKSHLQKYRYEKGITESRQEKSNQLVDNDDDLPMLYLKSGMQVKEILEMQQEVQRHLCAQLEIQQNLHQAIKERGKQIKMMLEQLKETN